MSDKLHGLMAEFSEPEQLLAAARAAYRAGYRKMDAYSPFAVEGVAEAIGFRRTRIPLVMLLGGISGALAAYGMQWYSAVVDYRLNVGGRPAHSWPAFIPIAFEFTILFAALAGLAAMLWACGLPRPYHPVFNAPDFKRASQSHFFLCIEADDHVFDAREVREFFLRLAPVKVVEVEK